MVKCQFSTRYYDFEERKEVPYDCPEHDEQFVLESGFCIFHDKQYLDKEENHEIIEKQFQKKIKDYLSNVNDNSLFCIGYNLFGINIQSKEFPKPVYFDEVSILGPLTINCKFQSYVSFINSQFSGKGDINIVSEFSYKGDVNFTDAKFSNLGLVYFLGTKFSNKGYVTFRGAEFSNKGDVNLGAEFSNEGGVNFQDVKFSNKGSVNFKGVGAKFSNKGDVNLGAKFSNEGDVYLDDEFSNEGGVHLMPAEFSNKGDVNLGAMFSNEGQVNLGAKFSNEGDVILDAEFSDEGDVNFTEAEFSNKGDVFFIFAKFSNKGDVHLDAEFSNKGYVNFQDVKFSNKGDVDFGHAEFSNKGYVNFQDVKFSNKGDVDFADTKFSNKRSVHFVGAKFTNEGRVDFTGAKFTNEGRVDFYSAQFSRDTVFDSIEFKSNVFFGYVKFLSPEDVRFKSEDLSNVSFVNTDITRIFFDENTRFGKLDAKKKNGRIKTLFERFKIFNERRFERFKIFDETRFEESIDKKESDTISNLKQEGLSLGSILTSYRNLRENYEYRLRYEEAGQFFVREMEIKRKYREKFSTNEKTDIPKENDWLRRNFSFIGLYHNICNYGESSTRPLILFGIIMLLSAAYWVVSSSVGSPLKDFLTSNCSEPLVFCSVERTLSDIVGFPEKGIIIDYATRISSIIVLATLFLPFRRKFERRFRH
jgi:uncharacterized protein YjbI with pentapeptide repeats